MVKRKAIILLCISLALTSFNSLSKNPTIPVAEFMGLMPYAQNPWYWQYRGEPIVLIGGSDEDNLFQWTGKQLTDHLDLLVSVGGNYLRNTMSDRDELNSFAFKKIGDNRYDLNQWNEEYWQKLTFYLEETNKRGIINQLTLWDHFDISSTAVWNVHPWNPENNINMATDSWKNDRDFYSTLARNDHEGLKYQHKFIDKLLSVTLNYDNVLYNINNESTETAQWENYWARYILESSEKAGRKVFVTTMQFDPSNSVRHVLSHRDIFGFVEISQNNQDSRGGRRQGHWDNIMFWRKKITSHPNGPLPMNNEKVYGSVDGVNYSAGSESEAIDRFWRNIFAGCASSRFHRPAHPSAWGSGLNQRVQTNLLAMSMLLKELDIFSCQPHNDLLVQRVQVPTIAEAYVTAAVGKHYAVYFPPGRYTVSLDPWVYVNELSVRWLDIDLLEWSVPEIVSVDWEGGHEDWGRRGTVKLTTPSNRPYVALLEVVEQTGE